MSFNAHELFGHFAVHRTFKLKEHAALDLLMPFQFIFVLVKQAAPSIQAHEPDTAIIIGSVDRRLFWILTS